MFLDWDLSSFGVRFRKGLVLTWQLSIASFSNFLEKRQDIVLGSFAPTVAELTPLLVA